MLTITGGIVLAFFTILFIAAFAKFIIRYAILMACVLGFLALTGFFDAPRSKASAQPTRIFQAGTNLPPAEVMNSTTETPSAPAADRTSVALAAYKEAVEEYADLSNKAAALEANQVKAQIKTRLNGGTVVRSSKVQATYDAKDIAEAKMNAAEAIMNAAITDMDGNKK